MKKYIFGYFPLVFLPTYPLYLLQKVHKFYGVFYSGLDTHSSNLPMKKMMIAGK
jgi:hypothetical protein